MTKEQQKKIDQFHERVIQLIFKRRRAQKYGSWTEEEAINAEIFKIEDERRLYERNCRTPKSQERKIEGGVRETAEGEVRQSAEADVRP